jgi:L-iditol 2-dehydrogenase
VLAPLRGNGVNRLLEGQAHAAALPMTMRAAVLYDVDDIRIEERPLPVLEAGDLLVATGASGVCSGDLMPWYVRKKAPFVFGHEPAGTVVAIGGGDDARPEAAAMLGKRVFAHHHAACMRCLECRTGRYVHCATWRATSLDPGGMSDYFRVPYANVSDTLVLPAGLTFADGSLVEPLGCVVKSLRRAFPLEFERYGLFGAAAIGAGTAIGTAAIGNGGVMPALAARTLYVIGAGIMGLMHVAVATALGATVYVSDFNPARRLAAERLGAAAAFEPLEALERLRTATQGRMSDAVVCGPGTPAALEAAVEAAGSDATVLMFTPLEPGDAFAFDQSRSYFRDVKLVASYSCGPLDTRDALALISRGVVTAERVAAREFPFPQVEAAYDAMKRAEVIKAIVTFGRGS